MPEYMDQHTKQKVQFCMLLDISKKKKKKKKISMEVLIYMQKKTTKKNDLSQLCINMCFFK